VAKSDSMNPELFSYNSKVMDFPAILTLILTVTAAILLITELLRPDIVALALLVVLGITRVVEPEQVFAGFSGSAVMTLIGISMIGAALHKTGVTLLLSRWMQRLGGKNHSTLILVTFLTSAILSLFMNNIAAVGILLPAVMTLTRTSGVSPSRLLLPLAYGTILGGMATLFTTSNIIVSGALREAGFKPLGVLEFFPIGIPLVAVGAIYMVTAGKRMLPNTRPAGNQQDTQLASRLAELYKLKTNLYEIKVLPTCPLVEKTISAGDWRKKVGVNVIGLIRKGQPYLAPKRSDVIRAGDTLIVQGQIDPEELVLLGLEPVTIDKSSPSFVNEVVKIAEVVIPPHSTIIGKTLRDLAFREKHHLTVVAIWHANQPIYTGLADVPIQAGDALLVQGTAHRISLLRAETDMALLEEDPDAVLAPGKLSLGIGITLVTLVVAAIGTFPVPETILGGAILLVITGCMNMTDAYKSIEWKAIFLIAGMWPLSTALRETGLASLGVNSLLDMLGNNVAPLWIALSLILVAMIFTQFMSGQVAALIVAPLALAAAASAQLDSRALGMAVALGCSLAFMTPYGHPVNIMVMSSGGYHFRTFTRIGIPLTILSILVILAGLAIFWGL